MTGHTVCWQLEGTTISSFDGACALPPPCEGVALNLSFVVEPSTNFENTSVEFKDQYGSSSVFI